MDDSAGVKVVAVIIKCIIFMFLYYICCGGRRRSKRNHQNENEQYSEPLFESVKPLNDYLFFKSRHQLPKPPTYQNESLPGWKRIPELWCDILLFIPRDDVEKCQYINKFLYDLVETQYHLLPLREFNYLTIGCLNSVRRHPYEVFITPADFNPHLRRVLHKKFEIGFEHFPHFIQLLGEEGVKKINEEKRKQLKFFRYSIIWDVNTMDFCEETVETMKRLVEVSGEKLKAQSAYTTASDYSNRWAEVLDKYLLADHITIEVKEDEASMNFHLSLLANPQKCFIPLTTKEIYISFSAGHSTNKPKINLQNLLKFLLSDQIGIYRYNINVGATPDNSCEDFSNSIVEAYINSDPVNLPGSLRFDHDFPREFFYKKCKQLQEYGILDCKQFNNINKEYNMHEVTKYEHPIVFEMKRADDWNLVIKFCPNKDFRWMNVAFNINKSC